MNDFCPDAATRRNGCGGKDPDLVQVDWRRDQGRGQSFRGRNRQGDDRSPGDCRRPADRDFEWVPDPSPKSAKSSRSSQATRRPRRLCGASSTAPKKPEAWRSPFEEVSTPKDRFGPAKGPDGVRITPLARRLIAQNGADIGKLAAEVKARGSSRVDEQAVRAFLASPAAACTPSAPAEPAVSAAGETITLNTMRLRTGERLAESWRTIPHVFQAIEVDFSAIDRVRGQQKQAFKEANGFSLTYLPFIARATCLAIEAFPQVNARFDGKSLSVSSAISSRHRDRPIA